MKTLLKLTAALGVLTLAGCVVVPVPVYGHRPYGYTPAPPPPPGGGYYGPRRPRW